MNTILYIIAGVLLLVLLWIWWEVKHAHRVDDDDDTF